MKPVILKVEEANRTVYLESNSFLLEFSKRSPIVKGMNFKVGDKFKLTLAKVKK